MLHALGAVEFGIWVTIASGAALLTVADLGVGSSLLNAIARALTRNDQHCIKESVSSAFFGFLVLATLLVVAVVGIVVAGLSSEIFGYHTNNRVAGDASATFLIVSGLFLFGIPLSIADRVQLAYQQGWYSYAWQAVGQILGFVLLLAGVWQGARLPLLAAAVAAGPVIGYAGNFAMLFFRQMPSLRPQLVLVSGRTARALVRSGSFFLFLQAAWLISFATDNLIISHILGSVAVTEYAVPYRGFTAVGSIIVLPLMALWPTYTEAGQKGDLRWLGVALRKSTITVAAASAVAACTLALSARSLISVWTGGQAHLSTLMLLGFVLWLPTYCVGNSVAVYLNALGVIRFQVISVSLMTVGNVVLSVILVHAVGAAGAVLGSVVSYVLLTLLPAALYIPRHRRDLARQALPEATSRQRSRSL